MYGLLRKDPRQVSTNVPKEVSHVLERCTGAAAAQCVAVIVQFHTTIGTTGFQIV